ncbi:MAG: hypothetical protein GX226_02675 [Dehalococcoidales bacterium]|jgi:hypothetical protein|nr:hypothetical protein [Dehalococcoidales bacterium]
MAQLGITVSNIHSFGGPIDGVKSIKVFRGQYKYKDLKDNEQYITISVSGKKKTESFWEGEFSMPISVAKLLGQSLIDVSQNLSAVELQLE